MTTFTLDTGTSESDVFTHKGGVLQIQASGVFGGATLKFIVMNGTEEIEVSDFNMIAPDVLSTPFLNAGSLYKLKADSATGTTVINLTLF